MFCPRCSQEQVSEETKFCSRCGFPLGLVSEILTYGGFLPQLAETKKSKKRLTRRNGLYFSLFWFMFFSMILTPFWAIVDVEELAAISAVVGSIGALILVIASFAFLKKAPKNNDASNHEMPDYKTQNLYAARQTALPPQQTQPVQNYVSPANSWKAPDTGDLVQPGSVTESTTRLLRKEE
jgi:uncharacterized protein with PQ loop repeat